MSGVVSVSCIYLYKLDAKMDELKLALVKKKASICAIREPDKIKLLFI